MMILNTLRSRLLDSLDNGDPPSAFINRTPVNWTPR